MEKSSKTIYSFSAGPGVLPKEVLKKAQEELLDWHGKKLIKIINYSWFMKGVEFLF